MATADDSKLTGAESFGVDDQLRLNSGPTRESRHLISEAFSFLGDTQGGFSNVCDLSEKVSSVVEESCDAPLRRNSQAVRENRHLISDAFSFLKDTQLDTQDGITEAEEDCAQVYTNVCDNSKLQHDTISEEEHLELNSSNSAVSKSEASGALVYENISPSLLETVAKKQKCASRDTTNGPPEDYRSKDSGFASLERNHVSGFKGGERSGLLQSGDVNKSLSDDEDEEEEDTEQEAVFYENQPGRSVDLTYMNGAVHQDAGSGTGPGVLSRLASENLYDDLNLSTASNQPGNLLVQPSCLNDEVENAIATAAENFSGAGEIALAKNGEEAFTVTECKSDSGETDKTEKSPSCENTYDTFICIDFNKVDLSSGKPRLKPGTSVSNQPTGGLSNSKANVQEDTSDNYDEISEYLTQSVQQGEVMTPSKLGALTKMSSVDEEEDDDTEDVSEQSPKVKGVDQAYEYDTITFVNTDNVDTETVSTTKTDEATTGDLTSDHSSKTGPGSASQRSSKEMAGSGETEGVETVVTRKPKLERNLSAEIGSDDSSDEDIGIYAESFRRSNWIHIGEEGKLEFNVPNKGLSTKSMVSSNSPSLSPRSSSSSSISSKSLVPASANSLPGLGLGSGRSENLEDIKEDSFPVSPRDDVFMDPLSESVRQQKLMHKRSDSTTTTASEKEFKHQYVSRRKCLIQRADSQQEYHRLSARVYDQDKQVLVERTSNDDDLGLHLLDCHPAFITSVDPGSPADLAGIQEGQILVSVNELNVLTTDHTDIVKLIQSCEGNVRLGVATSDFQPVRDLQAAVMSGFMYKLGNSSFVRTWKKRYFILRQDNCLYYYKSDQDNHDPLGAVPLCGYTILRHTETSKDYCFKAEKYGARTYFFMTDNRDQLTDWVRALTEAAARSKKRKESFLSVSSHNVGLPALDIRRPECSGNLNKLNPSNRSWCKRYCVLKDACMYYYKDVNSFRAIGVAHLHGYKVDAENHPRKKHSFSLQPPESRLRSFHFAADNETDKKRWVETLIHSIQRWVQVDREAEC